MEGLVIREHKGHYYVRPGSGVVYDCSISSKLRKSLIYPEADSSSRRHSVDSVRGIAAVNPVAIGDMVVFDDADQAKGVIRAILPRRSRLCRRASGERPIEQVIIANVDQAVPVFAAEQPPPSLRMLDRFLAIAEGQRIDSAICMNKMDLDLDNTLRRALRLYEEIGYRVIFTSALTGEGVADFRDCLTGKISVMFGPSGVGKSTLLNALQPGLGVRVRETSGWSGKGQHTTTHLELYELDSGGMVADTPGMRELGIWGVDKEGVASLFREMRPLLGNCRFAHCSHLSEPGCAIKDAVASGGIDQSRYESYAKLREEQVDHVHT